MGTRVSATLPQRQPIGARTWAVQEGSAQRLNAGVGAALLALGVFQVATVLRVESYLGDSSAYIGLARSIAERHAYDFDFRPHTIYPPGFPLILAGLGALAGRIEYDSLIRFLPLFGTLALAVWYAVLKRIAGPTIAALCCLLVATSVPYYQLATQSIMSDLPFFLASGLVVWSWLLLTEPDASSVRPGAVVGICVLTVATVMIRTVGVAICAGLLAWAVAASLNRKSRPRSQWNAAVAASLAGLLAFVLWIAWSSANTASEDRLNHMRTYASQFGMKDPHRPERGPATAGDLVRRIISNAPAQTAAVVTPFTRLSWISPLWYSPFVAIPLLLLIAGVVSSLLDAQTSMPASYFTAYFFVYLLWPFDDERVRFLLPVAPLGAFLMWKGAAAVRSLARLNAAVAASAAALFAGVLVTGAILGGGSMGLQARASIAFWLSVLLACLTVLSRFRGARIRWGAAIMLERSWRGGRATVSVITLAVAIGLFQQLVAARSNLAPNPATFVNDPAVQAASWLRGAPDGVMMAQQYEIIHRLTGRTIQPFPVTSDARAIVEIAREARVRYMVVSRPIKDEYFFPTEEERLERIDRSYPGLLHLVQQGRNYRIFELAPAHQP
jgi:hypothetical protein